jgi:Zn ribbon nucleic-acid-binding protein
MTLSEDDTIWGVCRHCGYTWTEEPRVFDMAHHEAPMCQGTCGKRSWPMFPREADALRKYRQRFKIGAPCPECSLGELEPCETCINDGRPNPGAYCTQCGFHSYYTPGEKP